MRFTGFTGCLAALWMLSVAASASTAFIAIPDTENGQDITDASQRLQHQVRIEQQGLDFVWRSNGNQVLNRVFRGGEILFLAPSGDGMIVVFNQTDIPEEQRQGDKRPFLYCEHIRQGLLMKSYCGGTVDQAVIGE